MPNATREWKLEGKFAPKGFESIELTQSNWALINLANQRKSVLTNQSEYSYSYQATKNYVKPEVLTKGHLIKFLVRWDL